MRKFVAAVVLVFVLGLACIYVFIPGEIKVSAIALVKANESAVYRSLASDSNWKKWWPGKKEDAEFYLDDHVYKTGIKPPHGIEVIVTGSTYSTGSIMRLLPLSRDSMAIDWTATYKTSLNPLVRLQQKLEAKTLQSDFRKILSHFTPFAESSKNLYGMDIIQRRVIDTNLIVKKTLEKQEPTTATIYSNIADISRYIQSNGAMETNHPMLHINYNEKNEYELMVAIPSNKVLPGNGEIIRKRMVAGNLLTAEVRGGEATVKLAMEQMEMYVADHQKSLPALPYQLLVTDRMKETDTTKWITRIYYPVL